jgi:hypothetical protein
VSLAGRYSSPNNYTFSGTVSNSGAHLCYYQKGGENIQVLNKLNYLFELFPRYK